MVARQWSDHLMEDGHPTLVSPPFILRHKRRVANDVGESEHGGPSGSKIPLVAAKTRRRCRNKALPR